jgi:uncharacterized protein (TIGR02246 family)
MGFHGQRGVIARSSKCIFFLLVMLSACASDKPRPLTAEGFATQYTAAWCSHKAAAVAGFFTPDGSLTINQGAPSVGRTAIRVSVQKFMTAFPDLVVKMDKVTGDSSRATYYWTLIGTNSGPGGTGKKVQISGREEWQFGAGHHIAESKGHFDEADYQRQLKTGAIGSTM